MTRTPPPAIDLRHAPAVQPQWLPDMAHLSWGKPSRARGHPMCHLLSCKRHPALAYSPAQSTATPVLSQSNAHDYRRQHSSALTDGGIARERNLKQLFSPSAPAHKHRKARPSAMLALDEAPQNDNVIRAPHYPRRLCVVAHGPAVHLEHQVAELQIRLGTKRPLLNIFDDGLRIQRG
eukprot:CAMPEP_0181217876 /NCGR_PEP_ID=MMETSP1096-20121128/27385_1 /TAXON_ID=156174 ORGANISM="Chrysochromulina ericina, Strain CCMP281" /NCGR_SAMPLE_ID=MMETSP1096 /ASSEMBLY_ACC=CAM_ASM_000453 /LENGTH=177 /DNA_ID=CAMNT_0023310037 /DNA_START=204 /DNA_END=739 /DNA_ORIENTATION=-